LGQIKEFAISILQFDKYRCEMKIKPGTIKGPGYVMSLEFKAWRITNLT